MRRSSLAYERLRELIVLGGLAPGTRLIESDVAERLGVSRTPVRAAFQRLEQEGYILSSNTRRRARFWVAPLTREDAKELLYIIGAIESLAARWAAQLEPGARGRLTEELHERNGKLEEEAGRDQPDQNRIFQLDTQFHRAYTEAGAGPRLLALHDAIKPQAERYTRVYIAALVDQIMTSVQEHAAITDAILQGRADEAERAVSTNWRNAAARFASVIDSVGERGSWTGVSW